MFRLFISMFFKSINSPYKNFKEKSLKRFISDMNLISELSSKKKFFYYWRTKLQSQITNEKDQIKKIKTIKKENGLILKVNTVHSFRTYSNNKYITSYENFHYIFYISHFKITNMAIAEHTPEKYKKLLFCGSKLCKDYKTTSTWKNLNSIIDDLFNNYSSYLQKTILNTSFRTEKLYNRAAAVNYAEKYSLEYNTDYKNFNNNGGDCTNFISQCLHAGSIPLSNLWRPYTFPWIRVNELYYFLIRNKYAVEVPNLSSLNIGDIIQFFSNSKSFFAHSGIITNILDNGEILYSCHSYDKLNYPLSEIYPILYSRLRLIKITF
mgnify:CR=1 FL=1